VAVEKSWIEGGTDLLLRPETWLVEDLILYSPDRIPQVELGVVGSVGRFLGRRVVALPMMAHHLVRTVITVMDLVYRLFASTAFFFLGSTRLLLSQLPFELHTSFDTEHGKRCWEHLIALKNDVVTVGSYLCLLPLTLLYPAASLHALRKLGVVKESHLDTFELLQLMHTTAVLSMEILQQETLDLETAEAVRSRLQTLENRRLSVSEDVDHFYNHGLISREQIIQVDINLNQTAEYAREVTTVLQRLAPALQLIETLNDKTSARFMDHFLNPTLEDPSDAIGRLIHELQLIRENHPKVQKAIKKLENLKLDLKVIPDGEVVRSIFDDDPL